MRPLEGYKMLDLSRYLPGPYCSLILADLGMEVLRVEEPRKGDPSRWVGPRRNRDSVYFLAVNRNKRSIGINLTTEEGKEIFQRLCTAYDVILENFRPGTMDRLGLNYEVLKRKNPSLVFCSISGFGQEGPDRDRPGHDINYIGLAGLLGLTSEGDGSPSVPGVLISDLTAGLFSSIGILTALIDRNSSGRGRYIDISMMDGVVSLLCYHVAKLGLEGKPFRWDEMEFSGNLPCYRVYETADGRFMTLGAMEPSFWKNFCTLIGHPEMTDEQWVKGAERRHLVARLKEIFKEKTQKEWEEYFGGKEVCCEPVRDVDELFSNPQVLQRRMIVEMDHPSEGKLYQAGNPVKLSGMEEVYEPPPQLGENTEEVLEGLGYGPLEIALFKEKGVI